MCLEKVSSLELVIVWKEFGIVVVACICEYRITGICAKKGLHRDG